MQQLKMDYHVSIEISCSYKKKYSGVNIIEKCITKSNVKPIILLVNTTMNLILKLINVMKLPKRNFQSKEEAKSLALLRNAIGKESFLAG